MTERTRISLVRLGDLPIWKDEPFERIGRMFRELLDHLETERLRDPLTHTAASIHLAESNVEDGLERLQRIALQGNTKAARALVERVERGVVLLKEAAIRKPGVFRNVAHGQNCWPILYSDHPEEQKQFAALIQRLEVGKTAEINTMKPLGKGGARTRRWSQEDHATRVVVQLIGQLRFMQAWAEVLKHQMDDGAGTAKEIIERVRGILPDYAGKALVECADLGDLRPHSVGKYVEVIWKMLCFACDGHPERVVELRALAVRAAQRNTKSFLAYKTRHDLTTTAQVLARLRNVVGGDGPTLEPAMSTEVKATIRRRLESMVNPVYS